MPLHRSRTQTFAARWARKNKDPAAAVYECLLGSVQDGELFDFDAEVEPILDVLVAGLQVFS